MKWVAALAAVLMLTACTSRVGGEPDRDRAASAQVGAADLRVPLELCWVLDNLPSNAPDRPAGGRERHDEDGTNYLLDDPFLTVKRIAGGSVEQVNGDWVISLKLTEADGKVFGDWTTDHVGHQVAIVADEKVIVAPEIAEPILGNEVQIYAQHTREEAENFLNEITGR